MRIECPFCGSRDVSEFAYYGDAKRRPETSLSDASRQFYEAVYLRDNPAGRHEDLWYHSGGCRSWLRVIRDTRTHKLFHATFAAGEPS
ncbi:sarcosine oxidase subunit delta [Bradyrhizobium zhanjiangense]|uniref:Sarcosine oxidase subunit delta n=1 Tax=Bradyrhizobium zhanjiangense TaxID=1325107 RepID=A0ABY0D930_9BRAD|nr:sarcosine oxidase subunit delta [Bradyrhizobium zhanjiangense]RXG85916.1 sarcosine oxidase subunit delta [Bradyrhizobium zhanjiangense]